MLELVGLKTRTFMGGLLLVPTLLMSSLVYGVTQEADEVTSLYWRGLEGSDGTSGDVVHASSALAEHHSLQVWLFQTPRGNRLEVRCVSEISESNAWRSACLLAVPDSGWSFSREILRDIDVEFLPFAGGTPKDTDDIFDKMIAAPHLVTETVTSGEYFASYTAAEVLEDGPDQLLTVYGMKKLRSAGFSMAEIPVEALDSLSFAHRTSCGTLVDQRNAEGNEFCQILEETGFVKHLPSSANRYLSLTESGWERLNKYQPPASSNVRFMMNWGRLELAVDEDDGDRG